MSSQLKRFIINIPPMQTMEDVRQAISQAFTSFQNQLLSQLPITDMGGERLSNVAFPVDADDAVTLRYLDSVNSVGTSTATTPVSHSTIGDLVEIAVSTTPYNLPPTDVDVVTFETGASVVNLPNLTSMGARPIWLINASGTNITLNAASTQTLEGHSSLILYPNARLQLMPNA